MDPQVAWAELLTAWDLRDWEQVLEFSEGLLEWLEKGGMPPKLPFPKELGVDFDTIVVREACSFAHRRATSVLDHPNRIPQDVPFSLTCCECNNEGPFSYEEAIADGWQAIEHVPASSSENFLGTCPICEANDR